MKETTKQIDLHKLPKLENKNDAYWVDRDNNVGVLRFIGREAALRGSTSAYFYMDENNNVESFDVIDRCQIFNEGKERFKNNGIFMVICGCGLSHAKKAFIPNEETFRTLIESLPQQDNDMFYVVRLNKTHIEEAFKTQVYRHNNNSNDKVFVDRREAEEFWFQVAEKDLKELEAFKPLVVKCVADLKKAIKGDYVKAYNKISILPKDAVPGEKYLKIYYGYGVDFGYNPGIHRYSKNTKEKRLKVVIDHVDNGIAYLKNGTILNPEEEIVLEEKYLNEAVPLKMYENALSGISGLKIAITLINDSIKSLSTKVSPFDENVFFRALPYIKAHLKANLKYIEEYINVDQELINSLTNNEM